MGGERPDTRIPRRTLMLTILAGVATSEREIMLERRPLQPPPPPGYPKGKVGLTRALRPTS
jgi:hypothetical protein